MKNLLFTFLLLAGCFALLSCILASWQLFIVDNQLTVQLPAKPSEASAPGPGVSQSRAPRLWGTRTPEANFYILRDATNHPFAKGDTAAQRNYLQYLTKVVLTENRGQLLSRTTFTTEGGKGMEIKISSLAKPANQPQISYIRLLVSGSYSYELIFKSTARYDSLDVAGRAQRQRFFNSIALKP